MVNRVLLKNRYNITLANHGETLMLESPLEYLDEVVVKIRFLQNSGHLKDVKAIKIRGTFIKRIRAIWGAESFDKTFETQAEYIREEGIYKVVRSSNTEVQQNAPLLLSANPISIHEITRKKSSSTFARTP